MAEEKTEESQVTVTVVVPTAAPLPVKKLDPLDEVSDTLDAFFATVQSAGLRSVRTMFTKFQEKADGVITKLDGGVGGDPPPKP